MSELNKTMGGTSHRVNRFRANIVVGGSAAWEEDGWRVVKVAGSGAVLLGVKPCTRCNVPDIEQETGEAGRDVGRALVKHRWAGQGSGGCSCSSCLLVIDLGDRTHMWMLWAVGTQEWALMLWC